MCCRCTLKDGNTFFLQGVVSLWVPVLGLGRTPTIVAWPVGAAGKSELEDTSAQGLRVFGEGRSCSSPKTE